MCLSFPKEGTLQVALESYRIGFRMGVMGRLEGRGGPGVTTPYS